MLRTQRRHPLMAPRLGHIFPPREWQATFLSDDSSNKRLVQLHNRLPRDSQAAWRRSRLRNVVNDQCGAVEHKHTYIHVHVLTPNGDLSAALMEEDRWVECRLFIQALVEALGKPRCRYKASSGQELFIYLHYLTSDMQGIVGASLSEYTWQTEYEVRI